MLTPVNTWDPYESMSVRLLEQDCILKYQRVLLETVPLEGRILKVRYSSRDLPDVLGIMAPVPSNDGLHLRVEA